MNATTMPDANRHVVDRLADVRERKKAIEAEEKTIVAEVSKAMGADDSLGGDDFIARQIISERKGALDEKKLSAALGLDDLSAFRKASTTVIQIRLNRRSEDL